MKKRTFSFLGTIAVSAILMAPTASHAQVTLLGSFNANIGPLVGAGFDSVTGNVFIYPDFSDTIQEYTPTGTQVPPDISNPGLNAADSDLDFAPTAFNLGGTVVGANTLLTINSNTSDSSSTPFTLYGINKTNGSILSSIDLALPSSAGASYHAGRGTIFNLSNTDGKLYEINPMTGAILNSFGVAPGGSPAFNVGFGDVEVNQSTGNLYVVSSSQNFIRELTATGAFVRDFPVASLGISGMAGMAYDDATGQAYISSTNGNVYHIGGLQSATSAPEPGSLALLALGGLPILGLVKRPRRSA